MTSDSTKMSDKKSEKIDMAVDEIQAMMDSMEKKTFHALIDMEWEGCIQSVFTDDIEKHEKI